MHKFIILGNDFLPVNTRAEQRLAARALNKQFPSGISVEVYAGAHTNCDPTGETLSSEGELSRAHRHYLPDDE